MNINCEELVISQVQFTRDIEFEGEVEDMELQVTPEYAVSEDPTEQSSRLIVNFEAGSQDGTFPFFCNMQIVSIFSWDGWDADEAERLVMTQGMEIVLSFIRTHFYTLQQNAGLDPLMLPPMEVDFDDIDI